jgi:hypothetical protein
MATPSTAAIFLYGDTFNVADIKRVKPIIYNLSTNIISYKIQFVNGSPLKVCKSVSGLDIDEIMKAISSLEEERQAIIRERWPMAEMLIIKFEKKS